ncbi:MAG: S41 family peptidase [Acidobacteriota bacterium]|nr:S41 family peptidase [Acidobacteriota bacterium]
MKKSSNLLGTFLLAVFLLTNVYAQPAKTSQIRPKTSDEIQTSRPAKAVTTDKIGQDVAEALTLIEDNHVGGKKLDYNDLFKSSITSMLHTLDPHSNYFDAKEFEQFRTEQSSRYYGIGASIGSLSDKDGKVVATYIRATFEGAPANRVGFRYGDKIVEVNGVSMLGKPSAEVSSNLRGPRGTTAKITVERHGTGKRETVEIIRDAVSQPSIAEAYLIRPGVGYIAMTGSFNQTTYAEFRQAMVELKNQGMTQLVLDLRNNGGGLVNQALEVANTFLARGQNIFTQKGRLDGVENPYPAKNENPDNTPIVMLVNRNTASASEILAGALQDHDRALIVGENTFGKGLVQNPFVLEYGSMLLLTIAKYQTPSGRLIQRDYSDGNLYNYYTDGGSLRDEVTNRPKGTESKTDLGRTVYSGGGINPDEVIKPQTITNEKARFQQKFLDPIFAFTLDLSFGKIKGFETYKIDRPITFAYDLKNSDFQVTDNLYQTFKKFAAEKYNLTAAQVDREREYVERILRTELVTAAFGVTTSLQVFNEYDTQLKKAIELLPQAKQLALESAKNNALKSKVESNNR